jgi:hypothetical protein
MCFMVCGSHQTYCMQMLQQIIAQQMLHQGGIRARANVCLRYGDGDVVQLWSHFCNNIECAPLQVTLPEIVAS